MDMLILYAVICSAVVGAACGAQDLTFPPGFKFGVASAAYQVEGAWNVSDKSPSIWDRFVETRPEAIVDGSSGQVACDSYHLWERDVAMIKELGAHFYRFSIGWTRLLPTGFANKISADGARYYSDLIDALLEAGIEPVVTLYHWDLPQTLQDLGGWCNPLVAEWFADYARVAYSLFGARVGTWVTINEPLVVCELAYNTGLLAPGVLDPEHAAFLCNKHVLLAHARAYRVYDEEFRDQFHGRVSLATHAVWLQAAAPEHEALAELARHNIVGRYAHPIFSSEGGWPPLVEEAYAQRGEQQGARRSQLPPFTQKEIELMRGTFDYFALNHYTSRVVSPARPGEPLGPWPMGDLPHFQAKLTPLPEWPATPSFWFFVYPEGFRKQLAWIKQQYGDIPILITENGYPTRGGLDDSDRIHFYTEYLKQVLLAIREDGVNVTGYTAWTLMDNFEWMDGYTSQFGLYQVDFSSAQRTRTPRASAAFYTELIKRHSLDFTNKTQRT